MRWLIAAATAAVFLLFAARADAHAVLLQSDPASGAAQRAGPTKILLRFNSRVDHHRSLLALRSGTPATSTTLTIDPASPPDAIAAEATLAPGRYTLRWQVLATDGHITRGDVPFTVE